MRKLKICTLVLLCILTAGLCSVFAYGMSGHGVHGIYIGYQGHKANTGSTQHEVYSSPQLLLEKEVPLEGIDSITVKYDMNNNDVYLYKSEGDSLIIKEYNELALKEDELSAVTVTGSSIAIEGKRRSSYDMVQIGMFGVRSAIGYTEIGLPSSYKGQLSVATASGDVKAGMDIALEKEFQASAISGDITMPDITAQNIMLSATSGTIKIETACADAGGAAGAVSIKTVSGDINGKQLTGEIAVESGSGDIMVNQLTGKTDIKCISGSIQADAIDGETQLKSTSGDITIKCIDGAVTAGSSSGDICILDGGGSRTVRTTSGEVRLEGVGSAWDVQSTSGIVAIKAQKGSGGIHTTSGDISLVLEKLTGNLNIESSSGEVEIRLSGNNAFDFKAATSSGGIDTFFDDCLSYSKKGNSAQGTYGDNRDGSRIDIKTTSGDVEVTK